MGAIILAFGRALGETMALAMLVGNTNVMEWSVFSPADTLAAMLAVAQSALPVRPEYLDTDPWLLNVKNGTLDLKTGDLRPAERGDLLTKMAPVTCDFTATCPEWLAFLEKIFKGNAEVIRFVQKAAGYSMTGLDTEECLFIPYGSGQNGKTTFIETLCAVLGPDYAQQTAEDLLMERKHEHHATELASLRGIRLAVAGETRQGSRLNERRVKSMTGGERLRANFMHKDMFEFRPEFKLWVPTNHKPVVKGTDLGIWRRIRLIPFTYRIPDSEKDGAFKAKLRTPNALAGILNWLLEGVLLWQREGLEQPKEVLAATEGYRAEMDVLAAWIGDCCVVETNCKASAAELYASYSCWCDANRERSETQRMLGLALLERGFERYMSYGVTRYRGIGLREKPDPTDPENVDHVDLVRPFFSKNRAVFSREGKKPDKGLLPSTSSTSTRAAYLEAKDGEI